LRYILASGFTGLTQEIKETIRLHKTELLVRDSNSICGCGHCCKGCDVTSDVSVTSSRYVIKLVMATDGGPSDARVREIWLRTNTVLVWFLIVVF